MTMIRRYAIASEGRRRVDPEERRFRLAGIEPAMPVAALEPEAVARLQDEAVQLVEPDLQRTRDHEDELFALMRVGAVAAGERTDAEQHRLQHRRAARQQLHAHARMDVEHTALTRAHQPAVMARRLEQLHHGRPVRRRQPLQRRDRRVGLRALERAEEAGGDAGCVRGLGERQAAALAHLPQLRPERLLIGLDLRRRGRFPELALDARHVQPLYVAQVFDPLEDLEELRAVETIPAVAADRTDEADVLPQPQRRGADAEDARGAADGQEAVAGGTGAARTRRTGSGRTRSHVFGAAAS